METKSWNQYSKEEQNELLQHWWYYYGKMMITLDEWEQFNKLVEKDSNKMFELAVVSYIHGISSQPLVSAIRKNMVDELMLTLPNIEEIKDEKIKTMYKQAESEFISMIVKTYNSPEPNIPMEPEVMANQIKDIVKKKK